MSTSLARQFQQQSPNPSERPNKQKAVIQQTQSNITKGEKLLYGLFVLICIVITAVVITNYAMIYQANVEIHKNESAIQQQLQINEGLQLQVIELSAPDRILHIATEKLGMTLNDHNVRVIQN